VIGKSIGKRSQGLARLRPAGDWNTLDYLAAEGVEYVCDWTNDDQPYVMTLEGGKRIISIHYSHDINDIPAFERHNRMAELSSAR